MRERAVEGYLAIAIGAIALFALLKRGTEKLPLDELPLSEQAIVAVPVLGQLRRDSSRSAMLPPFVPDLVLTDDGIPTDAFLVMSRVGSTMNPHLTLDPTPEGLFAQAWQIPQVIELMPNSERIPWTGIAGVQGSNG